MTIILSVTVGFFMLLFCICFGAFCMTMAMKSALSDITKELVVFYMQKKVEAIEELDKKYGKPSNRVSEWQS